MSTSTYVPFEIDQDLTAVQEFSGDGGGPPALPIGEYTGDVVNVVQGSSKANNSKITVTFEVVEGDYTGTRIDNNYSLLPQAIGRWKKLAMACGAPITKISSDAVMGARVRFAVVHNEGKPMLNTDGSQKLGSDGLPVPPRIFANVANERPMEDAAAKAEPAPAPPPVTRKAAGAPAGGVRRA